MVSRLKGDDGSPWQDRARLSGSFAERGDMDVSTQPFDGGGRDDRKEGEKSSEEWETHLDGIRMGFAGMNDLGEKYMARGFWTYAVCT